MDYESPLSVASTTSQTGTTGQKKNCLKLECGKDGKVEAKIGKNLWDNFPPSLKEDVAYFMSLDVNTSSGSGRRMYEEVKAFLCAVADPSVKDMRRLIPKAVFLLFHTNKVFEGCEKMRDMWAQPNRPEEWPESHEYGDPNNGMKQKRNDLLKMHNFLKGCFTEKEHSIRHQLCLNGPSLKLKPAYAKVNSELCRTLRDLNSKRGEEKPGFDELHVLMDAIVVENSCDALRTFKLTKDVQQLILEDDMETKPPSEILKACDAIQEEYFPHQSSEDVGKQYLPQVQAPGHLLTNANQVPCQMGNVCVSSAINDIKSPDVKLEMPFDTQQVSLDWQSSTSAAVEGICNGTLIQSDSDMLDQVVKEFGIDAEEKNLNMLDGPDFRSTVMNLTTLHGMKEEQSNDPGLYTQDILYTQDNQATYNLMMEPTDSNTNTEADFSFESFFSEFSLVDNGTGYQCTNLIFDDTNPLIVAENKDCAQTLNPATWMTLESTPTIPITVTDMETD